MLPLHIVCGGWGGGVEDSYVMLMRVGCASLANEFIYL